MTSTALARSSDQLLEARASGGELMTDSVLRKLARFVRSRDVGELAGVSKDEMAACLELVDAAASQKSAALWRCRGDIFSLAEGLEIEPRDGASQEELTREPLLRTLERYLRSFDVKDLEGLSVPQLELCEGVLGAAYQLQDGLLSARELVCARADELAGVSRGRVVKKANVLAAEEAGRRASRKFLDRERQRRADAGRPDATPATS